MPKAAPIVTTRRVFFGLAAAAVIAIAILLLGPDTRRALLVGSPYGVPADRDLEDIRKDTLRVLVMEHHLVYERIAGAETGLEFEMLRRMAAHLHLPVKAVLVASPDSLMPMLQRGAGDIIATQLNQRSVMARWVGVTIPFRYAAPVIVTLREDALLHIPAPDLDPDTAWISAWSPFAPEERHFPGQPSPGNGRTVFTDTSRIGDAPVINVALGRVKAAIISDAMAVYCAERFPQLAFSDPIARPVPLVFGVRSNAPHLRRALDKELSDPREKEAMTMMMFSYGDRMPTRGALHPWAVNTSIDSLLPLDQRIRQEALHRVRNWDLLAAIAFQEAEGPDSGERLPPTMPNQATPPAEEAGSDESQAQVHAAARYLAALDTIWSRTIPDPDQRLRFVVAAYHAGPGHVVDAQDLATALDLDATRWEGQVERAMTLLALPRYFRMDAVKSGPWQGDRTFLYVRDVVGLYEHYRSAASVVSAWRTDTGR